MSGPHPGGDPNAHLYEQLKRDVLERVPQVTGVEYEPEPITAKRLRATVAPERLVPPTGPEVPTATVAWYRQSPHDWFRVDFTDPNTQFHAGWHQDEDHPDLGRTHFQYTMGEESDPWAVEFEHETPSLVLWEIIEELLDIVHPTYNRSEETGRD
jgi:hypothetical protein